MAAYFDTCAADTPVRSKCDTEAGYPAFAVRIRVSFRCGVLKFLLSVYDFTKKQTQGSWIPQSGASGSLRMPRPWRRRNGLHGDDYSTKLSPWLAHGCVTGSDRARENVMERRSKVMCARSETAT